MIILRKKYLIIASMAYIYIPIVLFLFGWTKIYIAILCCMVFGYSLKVLFNDFMNKSSDKNIQINGRVLVFVILFFLIIGYYAGWGNFVTQTDDWYKHNAVLSDLVERPWPVY